MDVILLKSPPKKVARLHTGTVRFLDQCLTDISVDPATTMLEHEGKWYKRVVVAENSNDKGAKPTAFFGEAEIKVIVPTIESGGVLEFYDYEKYVNDNQATIN